MKQNNPLHRTARAALLLVAALLTNINAWAQETINVSYIDKDGKSQSVTATVLTGTEPVGDNGAITLDGGTYVVNSDIEYNSNIEIYGDFHLILMDNCKMTVNTSEYEAIYLDGSLTIYGQTYGTGTLNATGNHCGIDGDGDITIYGGIVNFTGGNNGIYAKGGITINGGNVTATSEYSDGINAAYITINGGNVRATSDSGIGISADGSITLGWTNPTDRITIGGKGLLSNPEDPATVTFSKLFKDADGNTYGGTLSDDDLAALNARAASNNGLTLQPCAATYIDDKGTQQTTNDYTLLTGKEPVGKYNAVNLTAGTYVAYGNVTYNNMLYLTGDINLVLCDGCTMNVGSSVDRINGYGIKGFDFDFDSDSGTGYDLIITSQSLDPNRMGVLRIYTRGDENSGIIANALTINGGNVTADTDGDSDVVIAAVSNLTINGGQVIANATGNDNTAIGSSANININGGNVTATATANDYYSYGISARGNITINGGNVTATGSIGISADGSITLGWTNATDRITASSYSVGSGKTLTFTSLFTDGSGKYYSGTLTGSDLAALKGKTLQPCIAMADNASNTDVITNHTGTAIPVALQGRTLYKDGAWNTLCLPFDMSAEQIANSPLAGADIRTLSSSSLENGKLTLNFTPATGEGAVTSITAGKPYIIKWTTGDNLKNPVFTGVTISSTSADVKTTFVDFKGTYDPIVWDTEKRSILLVGDNNSLYYPQPEGENTPFLNACRAYFQLNGLSVGEVQQTRMNFGDENEVNEVNEVIASLGVNDDSWFSLDGRKLQVKPTMKGLYIHGGRKVVLK